MRVVSGIYKHRRFDVPRNFKARPTTDFAKENLFNVLMGRVDFDDDTSALDLFAGTGSISLELLSRGCGRVVCVEKDRDHYRFICSVMREVGTRCCTVVHADVFRFIRDARREPFDFVFADPPYALPQLPQLPDLVLESRLLKPEGLFVLEHGKDHSFETHPAFLERRTYGSVNFSFFKPVSTAAEPSVE